MAHRLCTTSRPDSYTPHFWLEVVSNPGGRGSCRAETGRERGSAGASPSQRMVLKCALATRLSMQSWRNRSINALRPLQRTAMARMPSFQQKIRNLSIRSNEKHSTTSGMACTGRRSDGVFRKDRVFTRSCSAHCPKNENSTPNLLAFRFALVTKVTQLDSLAGELTQGPSTSIPPRDK